MRDRGKRECIRAPGAVSSKKIARAPGEDGGQAEICGQQIGIAASFCFVSSKKMRLTRETRNLAVLPQRRELQTV